MSRKRSFAELRSRLSPEAQREVRVRVDNELRVTEPLAPLADVLVLGMAGDLRPDLTPEKRNRLVVWLAQQLRTNRNEIIEARAKERAAGGDAQGRTP